MKVSDHGISLFTIGLRTIDSTTGRLYEYIGGAVKWKAILDRRRRARLYTHIIPMTADVQNQAADGR